MKQKYRSTLMKRKIVDRATKSSLKLLQSILTATPRAALGALRTSPSLSLGAETGEPPLFYRYLILTVNIS